MKKVVFSIIMMIVMIVLMPLSSHAATYTDDFNDTTMNPALWTASGNYYMPTNTGGVGPFTFTEHDGVLNFASNDSGLAFGGRKKYDSTWTVDFNNDFEFFVQYNTPSFASPNPANGSLEIGLHNGGANEFELWSGAYNNGTANVFDARIDDITNPTNALRPDSGVIGINYIRATDTLGFIGGDGINNTTYAQINGFTSTYGFQNLRVYLEGDSDQANFNANFDNFRFQSPNPVTPVPEPATMVLFGIGSAAMAFVRKKKRV